MRIFLTGATGFVGSNLLKILLKNNHVVYALKRNSKSEPKIILDKQPNWIIGSFNEIDMNNLKNIDLLIHLASHSAQPPYDNLQNCVLNNVLNPLNFFDKAYKAGIKKYLIAGSCFEYGLAANFYKMIPPDAPLFPLDTYPASKAMASIAFIQWAIEKKVSLSIQRLFYLYGNGEGKQRFFPSLKKAALNGDDFSISKGEQIRDVSNINLAIKILYKESLRIFDAEKLDVRINNVGSGKNLSIKDFALKLWREFNAKGKLEIGSLPYRDREIMRYIPNLEKVHIIFNFDN